MEENNTITRMQIDKNMMGMKKSPPLEASAKEM